MMIKNIKYEQKCLSLNLNNIRFSKIQSLSFDPYDIFHDFVYEYEYKFPVRSSNYMHNKNGKINPKIEEIWKKQKILFNENWEKSVINLRFNISSCQHSLILIKYYLSQKHYPKFQNIRKLTINDFFEECNPPSLHYWIFKQIFEPSSLQKLIITNTLFSIHIVKALKIFINIQYLKIGSMDYGLDSYKEDYKDEIIDYLDSNYRYKADSILPNLQHLYIHDDSMENIPLSLQYRDENDSFNEYMNMIKYIIMNRTNEIKLTLFTESHGHKIENIFQNKKYECLKILSKISHLSFIGRPEIISLILNNISKQLQSKNNSINMTFHIINIDFCPVHFGDDLDINKLISDLKILIKHCKYKMCLSFDYDPKIELEKLKKIFEFDVKSINWKKQRYRNEYELQL
jgi:hypothetical protein